MDSEIVGVRDTNKVQAGHLKQCRIRSDGVQMRDRVLLRKLGSVTRDGQPQLGDHKTSEDQDFDMVGSCLRKIV